MKIKASGNWMRYICANLIEDLQEVSGTATAYPKARYIAFMLKGTPADQKAKFRIHYVNPVTESNVDNQNARTYEYLTIKANKWQMVTIKLDQTKTYYGWSLALSNKKANGGTYISVDSVALVL